MPLRIEIPGGLSAWRESPGGQQASGQEIQPGVVLREDPYFGKRLAEPETVRLLLEFGERLIEAKGAADLLYSLAKTARATWVKINGRRTGVDRAEIEQALTREQDTLRLTDD
jgi:hypothetical protein